MNDHDAPQAVYARRGIWNFQKQILVLVIVFATYLPALQNGFVNWDDDYHLVDNPAVRGLSWDHLRAQWTGTINRTYVPLTTFSFALEYHFFGYDPFIYHLDNVLLHLLVTALVIAFGRRLGVSPAASALAGLLFGIHPLHVESVAWVTERKDVLCAVFYMLALNFYLRYLDGSKKKWFWAGVLVGLLSILAKPMALSLPLVWALCDWYKKRPGTAGVVWEKAFLLAVLAPIAWKTYVLNTGVVASHDIIGVAYWVWCFMFYLWKFLVPCPTALFYTPPAPVSEIPWTYAAVTGLFIILAASLVVFKRYRLFVFAVAFYFLSIFFLLRFQTIIGMLGDRFMYLPSVGFCLLAAVGMERVLAIQMNRWFYYGARICLTAFFVLFAFRTFQQCFIWRNGVTLWQNQIRSNSRFVPTLAFSKLAEACILRDGFQDMLHRISADRKRNASGWPMPIDRIQQWQADEQDVSKVLKLLDYALWLDPGYINAYFYKGKIFSELGEWDAALTCYGKILQREPRNANALYWSGYLHQLKHMPQQAIQFYRRALQSDNGSAMVAAILDNYARSIQARDSVDLYRTELEKLKASVRGK